MKCGIFRAPPGRLELSAIFSEPSMVNSSLPSRAPAQFHVQHLSKKTFCLEDRVENNDDNNNNTIWGGSVLTGEEHPQAGGPTQSQLSRPMSSGHHISMEHRLRRKQPNSDTNASNKTYLKEIQEKRKEETFFFRKIKRK